MGLKIHLAKYEPGRLGGGWTFQDNFAKGFDLCSYDEADIYFVSSASMVTLKEVEQAFNDGKRIVMRIDNATRDSRNHRNGMGKMFDKVQLADLVIYQSNWARNFLLPFLKKDGPVILNGVDLQKFYKPRTFSWDYNSRYLYVRSSRDEGKQWIMAWYWFVNHIGKLDIVGKFSPDNLPNFDFYNNEEFTFLGEQSPENMPDIYKRNKYFLYTYLNDAMSNTAIEALCSGMKIINVYGMAKTGGMPEITRAWKYEGRDYFSLERMAKEYRKVFESV